MTNTPPPAPIVFLDLETTGLGPEDQIWEVAAIRRDVDGHGVTETELHLFVEHDEQKCLSLPATFREDHCARFPSPCSNRVATPSTTAPSILRFFQTDDGPPPVVVGINPAFDLGHLTRLIRTERPGRSIPWDYTPVDARHLAVGALLTDPTNATALAGPPWRSEDVSRALGINPDDYARHTALGDVRWAMAIYDAVINPTPKEVTT